MRTIGLVLLVLGLIGLVIGFVANRPKKSRKLTRQETQELRALRSLRDSIEQDLQFVERGDQFGDLVRTHISDSYRKQRLELE
jgi:uncharacterized membrane-anchored protein YhcB (DUF1043 family)